jgi:hypothetical protein
MALFLYEQKNALLGKIRVKFRCSSAVAYGLSSLSTASHGMEGTEQFLYETLLEPNYFHECEIFELCIPKVPKENFIQSCTVKYELELSEQLFFI